MEDQISRQLNTAVPLVSAWLGGELSYLEKLCLTSMVDVGHTIILYSYNDLNGVPVGVEMRDATEVMLKSDFICYSNGSFALGSNLFRYRLFSMFPCVWIDTDMYLLRRIESFGEYVFGWEDDRYINTAILGLPKNCPILTDIDLLLSKEAFFAPWWEEQQTKSQDAAVLSGAPIPLAELPWATIGPKLITYLAGKHGVSKYAHQPSAFYPIHWRDFQLPFLSGNHVDAKIDENTVGVHFWNHMLGDLKAAPESGSFVEKQCQKYEIRIQS